MKPVAFLGDSREAMREFPDDARRDAGHQLARVQSGLEPADWKPLKSAGSGVREIRIWDNDGTFRVIYVASYAEAIYVLHAFQKKTRATSKRDLELAASRLRELIRSRRP